MFTNNPCMDSAAWRRAISGMFTDVPPSAFGLFAIVVNDFRSDAFIFFHVSYNLLANQLEDVFWWRPFWFSHFHRHHVQG